MSENLESVKCDIRTPKRVLHFSDGVLEEYESEEEEAVDQIDSSRLDLSKQIVSKSWPTVPLISYVKSSVFWFGSQTLRVCDYLGENLANFFGITSPKYQFEIEEYERRIREQKEYETKKLDQFSGWSQSNPNDSDINCADSRKIPMLSGFAENA